MAPFLIDMNSNTIEIHKKSHLFIKKLHMTGHSFYICNHLNIQLNLLLLISSANW